MVDDSAPTIQYAVTTDQAPPARPSTFAINADGADQGAGIKSMTILIDGQPAASVTNTSATCSASPFSVPSPCPLTGHISVPIATSVLDSGNGQFEVEAVDAGGNRTRTAPVPLWSFGHYGASVNVAPQQSLPARRGVLSLAFKGTSKTTLTGRYAAPPTITGTVRDTAGAAMAGTSVQVDTRPLVAGGDFAPVKTIQTDKNGEFAYRLPRGTSREIRATATTGDSASVATLRVTVAAPVKLKTNRTSTRNKRSIKFTGSVPGAPKDARARVDLQAWAGRWVTFASATVRNGTFASSYKFTQTFSPTTYRFRAVLPADPDFPYAAGKSREVHVRVRP
jgi:hypothetical protein